MGLTINDTITLKNGMQVTGAYLTLNNQSLAIIPGNSATLAAKEYPKKAFTATGSYNLYMNRDAMLSNCAPLQGGFVDCQLEQNGVSVPLHQIIYDYIKANVYPNSTDC